MANLDKKINYNARNFDQVRTELINFVREYYPDVFSDFNDASVGMMLLELNAAVGDMLSFNTDRAFNETQINYAQERASLLELARTFGLNIPGNRPSITIVDWEVEVPVDGDTFDGGPRIFDIFWVLFLVPNSSGVRNVNFGPISYIGRG